MNYRDIKRFFITWVAVFLVIVLIDGGCSKSDNNNIDFTIDLTQAQFSALQGYGGSVVYNGIIIARSPVSGNYIAASANCTLDNQPLTFNGSGDYFICPLQHEFNEQGVSITNPGATPLYSYHTQLINNFLRIYS